MFEKYGFFLLICLFIGICKLFFVYIKVFKGKLIEILECKVELKEIKLYFIVLFKGMLYCNVWFRIGFLYLFLLIWKYGVFLVV